MNRKNYLIFSGILILCIIGFVYYKLQYSKDIFAQIVSKVGEVNLVDENGELLKKIETGYKIKTGEFLETKDNSSATIKFVDNSIAIISEKSLVEMKKLKYDEASKQSITNLLLLKGKVESTVTNQDTFGSEYKVSVLQHLICWQSPVWTAQFVQVPEQLTDHNSHLVPWLGGFKFSIHLKNFLFDVHNLH